MRDVSFFLTLFRRRGVWLLAGGAVALATVFASIGLMMLAGWFIAAAAIAGTTLGFNLLTPSAGIRGFAVLRVAGRYVERLITHEATFRVLADLRVWFFKRAIPISPGPLTAERSGDLLNRVTADIDALDSLYLRLLLPSVVALLLGVLLVAFLSQFSLVLTLAIAVPLLIAGLIVPLWVQRRGRAHGIAIVKQSASLKTQTLDLIGGLADLRAYGVDERQVERTLVNSDALLDLQARMARIEADGVAFTGLCAQIAIGLTAILGIGLVAEGHLAGALLAMFVLAAFAAFELVMPLPQAYQYWGKTTEAARRVRAIVEQPSPAPDGLQGGPLPLAATLRFDQVSFAYAEDRPALHDISLEVEPHGRLALVGESGSGKSSLLLLLTRFYLPQTGAIRYGDLDLRALKGPVWRQHVTLLTQRTHLFSGTVADNLLIAKPDADDDALMAALAKVELADFIAQQPQGLDTPVGEDGVLLSGGQARRLAMARALLKDAPILLLDEPTEGLDEATETQILRTLDVLMQGRTVLMATHRLRTVRLMQRVALIEDGRLRDAGEAQDYLDRAGKALSRIRR